MYCVTFGSATKKSQERMYRCKTKICKSSYVSSFESFYHYYFYSQYYFIFDNGQSVECWLSLGIVGYVYYVRIKCVVQETVLTEQWSDYNILSFTVKIHWIDVEWKIHSLTHNSKSNIIDKIVLTP